MMGILQPWPMPLSLLKEPLILLGLIRFVFDIFKKKSFGAVEKRLICICTYLLCTLQIDNGGKKKKYVESFQLPDEKKMVNISKPTLESGFVEATVKYGPQNYISSAWIRNTNSKTGESYSYKGDLSFLMTQ